MNGTELVSSPERAPFFLSSLRLPATLSSAENGWDGIALAITPVRVKDAVSIPPPDWHFLNIAPLDSNVLIENVAFACGEVKDSLARIYRARIQTILPMGVPGKFEWGAAGGGPLHIYLHDQWLTRAAEALERDPAKSELTLKGFLQDPILEHLGLALHAAFVAPGGCDRLFAETMPACLACICYATSPCSPPTSELTKVVWPLGGFGG